MTANPSPVAKIAEAKLNRERSCANIAHDTTYLSNTDPDGRIDSLAWLGDQAFGTGLECWAPLHPSGRADRPAAFGMTGWWAGSIIRSIPWESPPCTASWAARGPPPGNVPHWCFASRSVVLLVVPVYLLALELFGDRTAWLACPPRHPEPDRRLGRRQCPLREHVLALLDLWSLGGRPFPARGTVPLAAAGHRLRGARLSHPS